MKKLKNIKINSTLFFLAAIIITAALPFHWLIRTRETINPGIHTVKAKIISVKKSSCENAYENEDEAESEVCYEVTCQINNSGKEVEVTYTPGKRGLYNADIKPRNGNQVVLISADSDNYYFSDFNRTGILIKLTIIFFLITSLIGGKMGFRSVISLAVTTAIVVGIMIPAIIRGVNPLLVVFLGGLVNLVFSIYFSYGLKKTSSIALAGTISGLFIAIILTFLFTSLTKLSGFAEEHSNFIIFDTDLNIKIKELLMAGFVFGTIGVIDDVTISQVLVVQELINTKKKFTNLKLFESAIRVGRGHLSSMVNTLFIAYASSALPLLIIFFSNGSSTFSIVNNQVIAQEILRSLIAGFSLFIAIPFTTWFACILLNKDGG